MDNKTFSPLEINLSAPLFKTQDVFGKTIDLTEYKGKKVFLGFFRHAGCPFCNLRVYTLSKAYQELKEKGMEMIFFFESKESVITKSSFLQEMNPIPIISDPDKKWYQTYGLEESAYKSTMSHITSFVQTAIKAKLKGLPMHLMADGESINTMPAEFLLDQDLIMRKLHYSQRLNDRLSLEYIHEFAKA
ncbi:redoxin domain-containing protein [Rapidithrix thailandica]|uniref:Redoxin domain-containing protein n=1 Tax=Rapidithrix thailandica TaxID=413964 RepID=A0AAW9SGR2_9BACT